MMIRLMLALIALIVSEMSTAPIARDVQSSSVGVAQTAEMVVAVPTATLEPAGTSVEIVMDGDVIMGGRLPKYGVTCKLAEVRYGPYDFYEVRYEIPAGTRLRLYEQSRGDDRSWVMIDTAIWIKINTLCGFE